MVSALEIAESWFSHLPAELIMPYIESRLETETGRRLILQDIEVEYQKRCRRLDQMERWLAMTVTELEVEMDRIGEEYLRKTARIEAMFD